MTGLQHEGAASPTATTPSQKPARHQATQLRGGPMAPWGMTPLDRIRNKPWDTGPALSHTRHERRRNWAGGPRESFAKARANGFREHADADEVTKPTWTMTAIMTLAIMDMVQTILPPPSYSLLPRLPAARGLSGVTRPRQPRDVATSWKAKPCPANVAEIPGTKPCPANVAEIPGTVFVRMGARKG